MWALDDFTEANGATRVVPGQPPLGAPSNPARHPHGGGGDAGGVGAVLSGQPVARRRCQQPPTGPGLGVVLEYAASWLRPQENHFLAVPPGTVRRLPERLQELLGYNVRPPFIGYVDGRHPRQGPRRRHAEGASTRAGPG